MVICHIVTVKLIQPQINVATCIFTLTFNATFKFHPTKRCPWSLRQIQPCLLGAPLVLCSLSLSYISLCDQFYLFIYSQVSFSSVRPFGPEGLKGPEARSSVLGGLCRLMAWVRTLILLLFSHVILVGYFLSIWSWVVYFLSLSFSLDKISFPRREVVKIKCSSTSWLA